MDEILKDARFAGLAKDPKFRRIPKKEKKIKIDKRFQSMFTDKRFNVKYTVDKRGRPVNQTSSENFKKYYHLSSDDEIDSSEENQEVEPDKSTKSSKLSNGKNVNEPEPSSSKQTKKTKKIKNLKEAESEISENEASENDDFNFSSNGKLLLVKQPTESDQDLDETSDVESSADSNQESHEEKQENDLSENENQLNIKRDNEKKLNNDIKKKLRDLSVDYARGEGALFSDSSSDEESSEYDDDEDDIEHAWGELDKEAETTEEVTHRLAACNMDWDRIRAVDIMVLFNSFLPSEGYIKNVTVYPSEFGLKRMKEEEIKGPTELVDSKESDDDELLNKDEENEEGSSYHMEKLRQYQLNRLKYYYAIIEFDSSNTANKIYKECDGLEYESSSTKLDLRFVPDEETFDQEPREVCDKMPDLTKYTPRLFTTTALQQVKVDLTWDETNPERQEFAQKLKTGKIEEVDQSDLQAYIASGTSDEEESEDEVKKQLEQIDESEHKGKKVDVYKSLLKSITEAEEEKKKRDVELEFTWGLGIQEKTENLLKEKEKEKQKENLTPFEQYLEKRKEKRKAKRELKKQSENNEESDSEDSIPSDIDLNDPYFAEEMKNMRPPAKKKKKISKTSDLDSAEEEEEERRKAELELLLMDETEEGNKRHFDMKRIEEAEALTKSKKKRLTKRKRNLKEEASKDEFEVNVEDPRFTALYTSYLYNIDPTDPNYKKTKGTEAFVKEKIKRRIDNDSKKDTAENSMNGDQNKARKKSGTNAELNSLINSIKRNTKNINKCIK